MFVAADDPMYTQCHRSSDTNKMPQKVYIAAGYWITQPPTPAEAKPSQAKPSQFKGRPVYLPSPPAESPEFPTLSVAKPTRSDPSRAGPLSLQTIFFQGDHVYESPPSLFRARNPLHRYLYSRRCTHSAIAPATQTKCHKRFTSQPAIGSGVCLGGRGQSRPLPPNPPPALKPSQAKPSQFERPPCFSPKPPG